MDDDRTIPAASPAALEALQLRIDDNVVSTGILIEVQDHRFDKIEEDVATLAEHIGEIRRTLAEIAAGQQAQAQAAATLSGRVDAAEQATAAIKEIMSAYDERVRQVSASMSELRLATRDQAAAIILRPKGLQI